MKSQPSILDAIGSTSLVQLLRLIAAIRVAERLGPDAAVAILMVDSGLKYLSTDVYTQ